jgi:bifunctional ADP-heptose synthase (sugar kinase/adenylyltransferase)
LLSRDLPAPLAFAAMLTGLKSPAEFAANFDLDRAEVLASLESVDFVTTFHAERVTDIVRIIRSRVYGKGGDFTIESLDASERTALQEIGAEIRLLSLVPGKSTTAILEKSRS